MSQLREHSSLRIITDEEQMVSSGEKTHSSRPERAYFRISVD
jgi:hypothetical protein